MRQTVIHQQNIIYFHAKIQLASRELLTSKWSLVHFIWLLCSLCECFFSVVYVITFVGIICYFVLSLGVHFFHIFFTLFFANPLPPSLILLVSLTQLYLSQHTRMNFTRSLLYHANGMSSKLTIWFAVHCMRVIERENRRWKKNRP